MSEIDRETIIRTGVATSGVTRPAGRPVVARVVRGPDEGREVAIGPTPLLVGAHRTCHLVLTDPLVSSRHLEVSATREGIKVVDLGSTNGTKYQASRILQATLDPGSSVELGSSVLRFVAQSAPTLPPSGRRAFGGLCGSSTAMREVFAVLELASPTDATVLLQGPSGTGKEVAARAIHDHSKRAAGPFVIVDCGALPEQLAESHLFGHKRGAFTGAAADRKGAFAEAAGGTIFLDEIGELPLSMQAKLLRALEQRTVQPVGSDQVVRVDTRVVAATHRDLAAMVEDQTFRFDLFHRLAVIHVALPALRDRPEDIPELVRFFYETSGVRPRGVESANMAALRSHDYPGNVRELRNILERAWALCAGDRADFGALDLWLDPRATAPRPEAVEVDLPFKEAKEQWVERFERRYLEAVYARFDRNITHCAEHAGINRRHFRELLQKHHLYSDK